MRGDDDTSSHNKAFVYAIAKIANEVIIESGMNGAIVNYQSLKDTLKWNNLSKKEWTKYISDILRYAYMPKKDFNKMRFDNMGYDLKVKLEESLKKSKDFADRVNSKR